MFKPERESVSLELISTYLTHTLMLKLVSYTGLFIIVGELSASSQDLIVPIDRYKRL